jgi:hypothetical protein
MSRIHHGKISCIEIPDPAPEMECLLFHTNSEPARAEQL